MQTPTLLMLLEWSARTKLYPSISSRPSGVEESRYVSDKHMKSCLYIELCKLREVMSRQTIKIPIADRKVLLSFLGPGFGSISRCHSKRTRIYRKVITVICTPSK